MKFDIHQISMLLSIHKEAIGHPKLKAIADAAMLELESVAAEHESPATSTAAPVVEEEPTPKPKGKSHD